MRIAVCTDTLADTNGVARFLRDLAALARAAPDPTRELILITSTTRTHHDLADPLPPSIINLPPLIDLPLPFYPELRLASPDPRALANTLTTLRPDVVHCSTPGPVGALARHWALRTRTPLAAIYHTDFPAFVDRLADNSSATNLCEAWMRRFYGAFDLLITRSPSALPGLERLGLRNAHALTPGIDLSRFSPRFRNHALYHALGLPPDALRLLSVGRVSLEKNLPFLLRAWRTFRTLHPDANANLIIVGDGPYLPAMREAARAIGNIFFTGQLHGKDLAALYAGADLFLFPSLTDTLGQSAIEAQASALPAIVSDTGGPQDVIVPGVTGLALPARDTDACARAWADAIAQLCHDHQRRRSMAAAAHAHAQRYSLTASYEHYWRLHESVRSSAPPAPDPGTRSRAAGAG